MTDVKEHIVKVILCTNDRCNQNDDTSDCRFVIEPVQNVESFCLRRALVPLSSYSFSPTDSDSALRIQNEGQYPYPFFQAGSETTEGARYCNYFLIPNGISNPTQTFNDATKYVTVKMSWCYLEAGDTLSVGYMPSSGVYTKHIVLTNTTGSTVYHTHQEILDVLNYGFQTSAGFGASNVEVKSSVYGSAPQTGDIIQNVSFAGQPIVNGTPYFYCDFRKNPTDASWGGVTQLDVWLTRPSESYDSPIASFPNTGTNVLYISNFILSTGSIRIQAFDTRTVTFNVNQTYTIAQIISTFNSHPLMSGILGIQLTQDAPDPTGMPVDRIYLYNNFGVTIPDRYLKSVKWLYGNDTLGWETNNNYKLWLTTMGSFNPANVLIGTQKYNLTPDIVVKSVRLFGNGITDESTFITLVTNQVLTAVQITMGASIDYWNINQLGQNGWTGADLITLDPDNKLCYGFRFNIGQTTWQLGGVLLSNQELPMAGYDAQYWLDQHATFAPTTDTNSWAVNNRYYFHSNPSDQFIQLPVNTVVTLANIQTALNLITAPLVATIVPASNTITFVNGGQGTYRIRANKTLGIYDDSVGDQAFEIKPGETRSTTHPIDLSCNNSFMAIGLNLYHDGRCSLGLNDSKTGVTPRPSRKNIVATLQNLGSQVYGGHIAYLNDSDTWLPSYVKDLSEMHLTVYNDKLETALLNKQDVYLEIDLKCRVYRV